MDCKVCYLIITATVGVDVDLNMQLVKTLSFNYNRILQQSESESVIYGCRNKNWEMMVKRKWSALHFLAVCSVSRARG